MLEVDKKAAGATFVHLGFYLIASLTLIILDSRGGWLLTAREYMNLLVEPIYHAAAIPGEGVGRIRQKLVDREDLLTQVQQLESENSRLKFQQQRLESIEVENQRLSGLLSVSKSFDQRVLMANIVRVDIGADRHDVVINRGKNQGVYIGQPVVDAYGVVGQVVERSPNTARITLITDFSHTTPVAIRRNGLRTLVEGNGSFSSLAVQYLALLTDIEQGDVLITSGLGGRFPAGYPVARITEVIRDANAPFLQIKAVPIANLDRASEVLLVWHNSPEEEFIPEDEPETELEKIDRLPVLDDALRDAIGQVDHGY